MDQGFIFLIGSVRAGNPHASVSPNIIVNCWIKCDLINGGGSLISFASQYFMSG